MTVRAITHHLGAYGSRPPTGSQSLGSPHRNSLIEIATLSQIHGASRSAQLNRASTKRPYGTRPFVFNQDLVLLLRYLESIGELQIGDGEWRAVLALRHDFAREEATHTNVCDVGLMPDIADLNQPLQVRRANRRTIGAYF